MGDYRAPRFLPLGTFPSDADRPARLAAELGAEARAVVLRPIPEFLLRVPGALETLRLETERQASAPIPHLLRILELVELDDGRYFVEEYVDGISLAELRAGARARETAVPPLVMARILADACTGFEAVARLPGMARERPAGAPGIAAAIRVGFDAVTRFSPGAAGWPIPWHDDPVRELAEMLADELAVAATLRAGVTPGTLRQFAERAVADPEQPDLAGFRAGLLRCLAGGALAGPGYVKHLLVDLVPLDSPPRASARRLRAALATLASSGAPMRGSPAGAVPARESTVEPRATACVAGAALAEPGHPGPTSGTASAPKKDAAAAARSSPSPTGGERTGVAAPDPRPSPITPAAVAATPEHEPIVVLRWPTRSRRGSAPKPPPDVMGAVSDSTPGFPAIDIVDDRVDAPISSVDGYAAERPSDRRAATEAGAASPSPAVRSASGMALSVATAPVAMAGPRPADANDHDFSVESVAPTPVSSPGTARPVPAAPPPVAATRPTPPPRAANDDDLAFAAPATPASVPSPDRARSGWTTPHPSTATRPAPPPSYAVDDGGVSPVPVAPAPARSAPAAPPSPAMTRPASPPSDEAGDGGVSAVPDASAPVPSPARARTDPTARLQPPASDAAPTVVSISKAAARAPARRARTPSFLMPLLVAALGGALIALAVVHFSGRPSAPPAATSTTAAVLPATASPPVEPAEPAAPPPSPTSTSPTAKPLRESPSAGRRPVAKTSPKAAATTPKSATSSAPSATAATMEVRAPAGSEVLIDGVPRGVAPFAAPLTLTEGLHSIRVTKERGVYDTRLFAQPGQEYTLDVTFVDEGS